MAAEVSGGMRRRPYTSARVSLLESVQSDVSAAMKAGDRERAAALRVVASELQKAHKEASGTEADEVAVLQRERKRRVEAADAYREAGRHDLVATEEREAELIDAYLPEQLSDEELRSEDHTSELQSLAYLVCRLL